MTRLADSTYSHRLPAFFCRLCRPARGNLSRQNAATVATLSGACYNSGCHLLHKGITHYTFLRKIVCQQGCCSPLLETQSQRSYAPLDTSRFVAVQICACPNLYHAQPPKTQIPHTSSYVGRNMRDFLFAIIRRSNLAIKCIVEDWLSI